ncbi:50S ribosomal protein L32e [uncultured archaeon]|nr:50S ribosomal protein L32e [uncultured archaeon]
MAEKIVKKKEAVAAEEVRVGAKAAAPKTEAKIAEKKTEVKSEAKTETKVEAKTEKKTEVKKEVVKKKFIQYVKKENKKKSKEAYDNQKKLWERKHTPVFRGRFGKKNIRRKSIAKWDKWRKPHGIDLDKGLQHGFRPKIGYKSKAELRHIHPSGYMEVLVCNANDLAKIDTKREAARFSAVIGKKKRNDLMKKANEKGVWVLN